MPFKSKAQQKYMFANMPKLAKKWADKYGVSKSMPEHVKTKRKKYDKRSVRISAIMKEVRNKAKGL